MLYDKGKRFREGMLKKKLAQFSPVLDRWELERGPARRDAT